MRTVQPYNSITEQIQQLETTQNIQFLYFLGHLCQKKLIDNSNNPSHWKYYSVSQNICTWNIKNVYELKKKQSMIEPYIHRKERKEKGQRSAVRQCKKVIKVTAHLTSRLLL